MDATARPEWYSRGYLPHRDRPGLLQFITYRLADSLPKEVLEQMKEELNTDLGLGVPRVRAKQRMRIEDWLDAGYGSCILRDPAAAECVVDNWRRFAGERYDLVAWVVMPNHVHILIRVYEGFDLARIVQSWKSYTSRKVGEILRCRAGARRSQGRHPQPIWQREYWDRFIRNEKHFIKAIEYIHSNPVKAGLVMYDSDYSYSNASLWAD